MADADSLPKGITSQDVLITEDLDCGTLSIWVTKDNSYCGISSHACQCAELEQGIVKMQGTIDFLDDQLGADSRRIAELEQALAAAEWMQETLTEREVNARLQAELSQVKRERDEAETVKFNAGVEAAVQFIDDNPVLGSESLNDIRALKRPIPSQGAEEKS